MFLPVLRLWSVSRVHGYVTPADFVRGRYGSPLLALLVAITGLVATMPYIALQLVGLEAVLRTMGLNATGIPGHLPLLIAFVILAVYTYQSGLRAPALIAFVKDILIYIVILVAVIYLPAKLGGWGAIFGAASDKLAQPNPATGRPQGSILLTANNQLQYVTLALGSALALFLYPHSLTGILASRGRNVIKRNMMALPAYSLLLGLLALLGYVAIAAGAKPITNNATGRPDTNTIIPVLFDQQFNASSPASPSPPSGSARWCPRRSCRSPRRTCGPATSTRSTSSATPRRRRRRSRPSSPRWWSSSARSLFIIAIDPQFSIDLQLIGGVIILQTLPAVAIALYTRWLHRWALVAGWAVGMGYGLYLLYLIPNPAAGRAHFGGSALALDKLTLLGWHPFGGFAGADLRRLRGAGAQPGGRRGRHARLRARRVAEGVDATSPLDYHADEESDLRPTDAPAAEGAATR